MVKRLVFILLFFPALLQAQTTWYIGPSGNDGTGTGTYGNPWRSFYYAIISNVDLMPGDKIYAFNGTYNVNNMIDVPEGIDIEGESQSGVVIECQFTGNPVFRYYTATGWDESFAVASISYLTFDGNYPTINSKSAIEVLYRDNVHISNCTFKDFGNKGVYFYGQLYSSWVADNPYVSSGDIYPLFPSYWCTGNIVEHCTITNCASIAGGGLMFGTQDGFIARYNTITQNTRGGGVDGYPVKFNPECLGMNKRTDFHDNTVTGGNRLSSSYYRFAIEMWYDMEGCHYYNNIINGTVDLTVATHKGSEAYSSKWDHNIIGFSTVPSNDETGINIEHYVRDVIISENIFKNLSVGIEIAMIWPNSGHPDNSSVIDVTIKNNIFSNIGLTGSGWTFGMVAGIQFSSYEPGDIVDNIYIYNNTIVCSGHTRSGLALSTGVWLPSGQTTSDFNVKNNIIYGFNVGTSIKAPVVGTNTTPNTNLAITYNNFYGNGNSNNVYFGSYGYGTYIPSGSADYTTGNIKTDPLFNSAIEFWLQTGSGAIRTGTDVANLTDYLGNDFANPNPTMGAYEYYNKGMTVSTLTTTAITGITNVTATSGGHITYDGGAAVTARGVCWSVSANPTTADSHTSNGTGTGIFTSSITGLSAETYYHVRAYATNSVGTSYGEDRYFQTNPDGGAVIIGIIKHNGRYIKFNGRLIVIE